MEELGPTGYGSDPNNRMDPEPDYGMAAYLLGLARSMLYRSMSWV